MYAPQDPVDIMLYARFLKPLRECGARSITLIVNNSVINFFAANVYIDNIIADITITENFYDVTKNAPCDADYEVHLMSLPSLLKLKTPCMRNEHLFCDRARQEHWRSCLACDTNVKVGICFKDLCCGDNASKEDLVRKLMMMPNVSIYCLDKDPMVDELCRRQECCKPEMRPGCCNPNMRRPCCEARKDCCEMEKSDCCE